MRIKIVAASLSDITGGILGSGVVPHPRLWRADQGATAGLVTVTAAEVTILTVGTFGLTAGDRLLLIYEVALAKGGTSGHSSLAVRKTGGTADVNWSWGATQANWEEWALAGETKYVPGIAIGNCVNGGTLTLAILGTSQGSDSTVPAGGARAHFLQFAGS